MKWALAGAIVCASIFFAAPAGAACRPVEDMAFVAISDRNLAALAEMQLDRARLFAAMKEVSIPESGGCWGTAAGNFDGQLISAGAAQWNYGQKTLQPLMKAFRLKFATAADFDAALAALMPVHGSLIFSPGCTAVPITLPCKSAILDLQRGSRLKPPLQAELENLLHSDLMIQVQVDQFTTMLTSLRPQLKWLFPGGYAPPQLKWALDTYIQQGSFPHPDVVREMRRRAAALTEPRRKVELLSLVKWYEGSCGAVDQDGCRLDVDYNVRVWTGEIEKGVSPLQFDLLNLSQLRSRIAKGDGGRYQANTFQRRAVGVLGVGSLGGRRFGAGKPST